MNEFMDKIHDQDSLEEIERLYNTLSIGERKKILDSVKGVKDDRAGKFLNRILSDEKDKGLRKEIKTLLFRLKTVGVAIEESRPSGESALRKIVEKRIQQGFTSNYDFENIRVVVAVFEVKKNSFLFMNAVIHFLEGIVDLKIMPLDKKNVEAILDKYREGSNDTIIFLEVSPQYALYLVEEADARSRKFADEVRELKQFSSSVMMIDGIQKPEDIYALNPDESIEPASMETLLSDPLFTPLTLTWDTIEDDRKTYAGLGESTIILPSHMVEEKRRAFIADLIERDSLRGCGSLIRRTLEDYAYMFYLIGRFDCFSGVMEVLRHKDGPSSVLARYAEKMLDTQEQADRKSGVIVSPYEQIHR